MSGLAYSVIIPVFNEEEGLVELHTRLTRTMENLKKPYEIIFVDDGSKDESFRILRELHEKDGRVKVIRLTKNFGQHHALMAGFKYCSGNTIITLDADLQNPPEEIPKLLKKLEKGFDAVYGVFEQRQHALFKRITSKLNQYLMSKVIDNPIGSNFSTFRAVDCNVIKNISNYKGGFLFIDGLIGWVTSNMSYVKVKHAKRHKGDTKYNLSKLIFLGLNMLTNFSIFPLQAASILGFIFAGVGFLMGLYFLLVKIIYGMPVAGFASIIIAITIFSGVQLITIGIIGEYIGRIHLKLNEKPQFIIRDKIGL